MKNSLTTQINANCKEQIDKNSKRFSQTIIFIRMGKVQKTGFYYPFSCDILAPPATNVPLTIIEEESH